MTDSRPLDPAHAPAHAGIDPERARGANAFDKDDHFTGQTYHRDAEAADGERAAGPASAPAADPRDVPPEAGRRARVAKDGSVHGSGVGTGGGSPGEDMDSSSASGDSEPVTGGQGGDGRPQGLGPRSGE